MASSKEYLHFILEQLSDLEAVSYRSMMGEFILYYRGKIVGGIYDDRLLVKKTRSALELMPEAICDLPYEGAKEMWMRLTARHFLQSCLRQCTTNCPCQNKRTAEYGKAKLAALEEYPLDVNCSAFGNDKIGILYHCKKEVSMILCE